MLSRTVAVTWAKVEPSLVKLILLPLLVLWVLTTVNTREEVAFGCCGVQVRWGRGDRS